MMKRLMMVLALTAATPLMARDLPVPANKAWQHAQTGLILQSRLGDLARTSLSDATASEHDVTAQFETPDKSVFASIYLFHPAVPSVGMWFDRSRTAVETRDTFRSAAPASIDPISFAIAGAQPSSALRQTYALAGGQYRSTALAVVPVGEWIVTVRMSAKALTADQLDAKLMQVLTTIRWPKASGQDAVAAVPVKACGAPLAFGNAKELKAGGGDMFMAMIAGAMASRKAAPSSSQEWCREGDGTARYGVYRSNLPGTGYVMALADAGRVVSVYPSLAGKVDKSGAYAVSLEDVDDSVTTFPSFSEIPKPSQVWSLIETGRRTGVARGNQVTFDAKSF